MSAPTTQTIVFVDPEDLFAEDAEANELWYSQGIELCKHDRTRLRTRMATNGFERSTVIYCPKCHRANFAG